MYPPTAVALGDWHGDTDFAIAALTRADTLVPKEVPFLHVGDFGFFPQPPARGSHHLSMSQLFQPGLSLSEHHRLITRIDPARLTDFLPSVDRHLRTLDRVLYVILGNHEDYWSMSSYFGFGGFIEDGHRHPDTSSRLLTWGTDASDLATGDTPVHRDEDGFLCSPLLTNIRVVPRTHVWSWNGVTLGSLGGACSIDRWVRMPGWEWWPEEEPTLDQANTLADARLDVLVTHDGPLPAVASLYAGRSPGLPVPVQQWADHSSRAVEHARDLTSPDLLVHGHHHRRYDYNLGTTLVTGLAANVSPGHIDASMLVID